MRQYNLHRKNVTKDALLHKDENIFAHRFANYYYTKANHKKGLYHVHGVETFLKNKKPRKITHVNIAWVIFLFQTQSTDYLIVSLEPTTK